MLNQTISEADRIATSIATTFDGEVDALRETIRTTMKTMDAEIDNLRVSFLGEIQTLADTVSSVRVEISSLRTDKTTSLNPIPGATDELDAVVEHTAVATSTILDACEQIDSLAASLEAEPAALVQDQTMRIYEACSFQDLTGQRISKVITALKTIEARIEAMNERFGSNAGECVPSRDPLLNGPQSAGVAISQDEIDRLLTF